MGEALHYKSDETAPKEREQKKNRESEPKPVFRSADKMFMAFMITFAAASLNYEAYIPEKAAAMYRILMWTVCAAVWAVLSFTSGMKGKWQFEVFAAAYLIVPQVLIFLSNSGPEFCRFSLTLYSLSEFSSLLLLQPVYMLGDRFDISYILVSVIYMAVLLLIFGAGVFVSKRSDIFKIKR
ncbi:MAG: hypothetical protein ACI4YB_02970 [Oscillospiraceae bacterium]